MVSSRSIFIKKTPSGSRGCFIKNLLYQGRRTHCIIQIHYAELRKKAVGLSKYDNPPAPPKWK